MTIPSESAVIMKDLGRSHDYSWDKPARIPPRVNLTSYVGAKYVLERSQDFNVMWTEGFENAMGKGGLKFMLAGDSAFHTKQREVMSKSLYRDQWHKAVKDFYEYQTLKLLREKSCKIAGINQVDITRE
jgi:linoleate 10R-lipoxygenase